VGLGASIVHRIEVGLSVQSPQRQQPNAGGVVFAVLAIFVAIMLVSRSDSSAWAPLGAIGAVILAVVAVRSAVLRGRRRPRVSEDGKPSAYDEDLSDLDIRLTAPPTAARGRYVMPAPSDVAVTSPSVSRICPYCQTAVEAGGPLVQCDECQTLHHQECWRENGGCTTFGCQRAPIRR
jgi:hypothetical protein